MENFEYKNIGASVKDVDSSNRIVTGYLSNFGNIDLDDDIMQKGAFSKSLMERKNNIFFLNQHNWNQPLSKFAVLQEDEKGLYFESNPLPNTTYADDVLKLYDAGVLDQHSIGFQTIVSEFDQKSSIRTIKEVKLYEGSVVTMAANPSAIFTGVKCLTLEEIGLKEKKLIKSIKNGTFTDETFVLLEIALKQLQLDAYELGKKSLEAVTTVDTLKPISTDNKDMLELLKNFKTN